MTPEEYKGYQKILNDYGGFDPAAVVNHSCGPAFKQRMKMRRRLIAYERKYGSVHKYLVKYPQDYADYCMIVNSDTKEYRQGEYKTPKIKFY